MKIPVLDDLCKAVYNAWPNLTRWYQSISKRNTPPRGLRERVSQFNTTFPETEEGCKALPIPGRSMPTPLAGHKDPISPIQNTPALSPLKPLTKPAETSMPQAEAPLPVPVPAQAKKETSERPLPPSWRELLGMYRRAREQNAELSALTQARLLELESHPLSAGDYGYDDWVLAAVDVVDEVAMIERHDPSMLTASDLELRALIKRLLSEMQVALIDEDEWNPARQRAIAVQKGTPPAAALSIKAKGSSGIEIQGRLLRKQEVTLIQ